MDDRYTQLLIDWLYLDAGKQGLTQEADRLEQDIRRWLIVEPVAKIGEYVFDSASLAIALWPAIEQAAAAGIITAAEYSVLKLKFAELVADITKVGLHVATSDINGLKHDFIELELKIAEAGDLPGMSKILLVDAVRDWWLSANALVNYFRTFGTEYDYWSNQILRHNNLVRGFEPRVAEYNTRVQSYESLNQQANCPPPPPTGPGGMSVSPTSGLLTTEDGGQAQFSVVLISAPTSDVTVSVSSGDTSEGTVSSGSLLFTPANWNSPQSVILVGVDDNIVDGDIAYNIFVGPASSSDLRYNGLDAPDVTVVNRDNDGTNGQPGIAVSPASGLTTSEGGATATFSVVLRSAPTADVNIALSCTDTNEGTIAANTLTFTPANWQTAQAVTVTGVDDADCDGDVSYSVTVGPSTSLDTDYNGRSGPSASLVNEDNEQNQCNCQLAGTCPPPPPPPCTGDCGGQTSQTVSSFDPNEKFGPAGFGSSAFVSRDGALAYLIRFENKSDATAPARQVVVSDTLDASLDLSTLELTEITFANRILPVPAGLNHYEARVPMTVTNATGTTSIVVDVQATLDAPTRTLTLTLTALDPLTGWFPEDPLTGLLYPNNATGRGEGSISYLIKPKAVVPTGTQIPNRAQIVFDYNDPIDTPLVHNTIDAVAPDTAVQPLPPESPRTFLVQWSAQDDAGGSGFANADVYLVADATNKVLWLANSTTASGWFTGVPGHSYAFYTVARDNVGNVEATPAIADAFTIVPTNAPVLNPVTNTVVNAGSSLLLTNLLQGGTPVGRWQFSLDPGSPSGASVNPTNGVFHWTPSCAQASTTNVITVRVTDDGQTNMTDTASFLVVVGDCVQPSLGQQILLAGQSGRVPVNLISSVPLTNLGMTLVSPPGHFVSFALEPIVPEICSNTVTPTTNGWYLLNLGACPNQFLIDTQQIAWLNFTTLSNQSSAFVGLSFSDLQGYQPDGTPLANFAPQSGRIVVLGEEPLLEMVSATNRQPQLILYGKPSSGYAIQWRTNLSLGSWQTVLTNLTITTNLFLDFTPPPGSGPVNYYRALRTDAPIEKILGLAQMNGTNVQLSLSGVAARPYRVQFTPTLSPPAWQTIGTIAPASDGQAQFTDTNGWWQTQRYYRFVWP